MHTVLCAPQALQRCKSTKAKCASRHNKSCKVWNPDFHPKGWTQWTSLLSLTLTSKKGTDPCQQMEYRKFLWVERGSQSPLILVSQSGRATHLLFAMQLGLKWYLAGWPPREAVILTCFQDIFNTALNYFLEVSFSLLPFVLPSLINGLIMILVRLLPSCVFLGWSC